MKRLLLFGFLFVLVTSAIMSCQKELSYETDQSLGHGTLYDSLNVCQPMIPNGTYYNGVSADRDTNFVKVVVTITQTGSYSLNTGLVNGFGFSDTGYFTKLGVDTLVLHAYGTPTLNIPTDFTITLDSSTCGFTINVQDSTGTGLGSGGDSSETDDDSSFVDPNPATTNTWHFIDSTTSVTYNGIFDASSTAYDQGGFLSSTNDTLYLIGQTSVADTLFGLSLVLPTQSLAAGQIYPVNESNILVLQTVADQEVIYGANDETAALGTNNSYITITAWDATTKEVAGSFHAWAVFNGRPTLITGSFNCVLR